MSFLQKLSTAGNIMDYQQQKAQKDQAAQLQNQMVAAQLQSENQKLKQMVLESRAPQAQAALMQKMYGAPQGGQQNMIPPMPQGPQGGGQPQQMPMPSATPVGAQQIGPAAMQMMAQQGNPGMGAGAASAPMGRSNTPPPPGGNQMPMQVPSIQQAMQAQQGPQGGGQQQGNPNSPQARFALALQGLSPEDQAAVMAKMPGTVWGQLMGYAGARGGTMDHAAASAQRAMLAEQERYSRAGQTPPDPEERLQYYMQLMAPNSPNTVSGSSGGAGAQGSGGSRSVIQPLNPMNKEKGKNEEKALQTQMAQRQSRDDAIGALSQLREQVQKVPTGPGYGPERYVRSALDRTGLGGKENADKATEMGVTNKLSNQVVLDLINSVPSGASRVTDLMRKIVQQSKPDPENNSSAANVRVIDSYTAALHAANIYYDFIQAYKENSQNHTWDAEGKSAFKDIMDKYPVTDAKTGGFNPKNAKIANDMLQAIANHSAVPESPDTVEKGGDGGIKLDSAPNGASTVQQFDYDPATGEMKPRQ